MTPSLLIGVVWQKSSYSNPCGSCVAVAQLTDGRIAIRNSREPGGPALVYPRAEMAALIHDIAAGEFDDTIAGSMHAALNRSRRHAGSAMGDARTNGPFSTLSTHEDISP